MSKRTFNRTAQRNLLSSITSCSGSPKILHPESASFEVEKEDNGRFCGADALPQSDLSDDSNFDLLSHLVSTSCLILAHFNFCMNTTYCMYMYCVVETTALYL